MNTFNTLSTRTYVAVQSRLHGHSDIERGSATAEYGVVILVAIALGMAVLSLFTGGRFDDLLHGVLGNILKKAANVNDFA